MSQPPAKGPHRRGLPDDVPAQPEPPAPCGPRPIPTYKLVLHHNPALELMFIVRSVMELTRFPRAEATHKMWEAYHCGSSVLFSTYLERAELYADQFASKGLTVTVELG